MGSDRPIFVAGCPRSGTTLMQLMLHSHPRIAIPPENRFVLPNYMKRRDFGDLRKAKNRRKLAEAIVTPKATQFRDMGLSARNITKQIVEGPPTVGSALGIVFRAYAEKQGKPRWGDKRPGYHGYLSFILGMFPDAQIIHLVRDGRDCVASLKKMPWWHKSIYQSIEEWTLAVESGRRAARRLSPDTFHQVQYERLVADPTTELKALCEFLGEEFDDAMTRPADVADVAVPKHKTWHVRTHEDVSPAAVGNWHDKLEPWELALCERIMGRQLRAYGYPPADIDQKPTAKQLLTYAQVVRTRRQAVLDRHVRDRWRRYRDDAPVQAVLTEAQRSHLSESDRAWLAAADQRRSPSRT